MSQLEDLYQEVILGHYKQPRNFRVLEDADRSVEGHNPLCGDRLTVYLKVREGVIRGISFQGSGCAISVASASLMTEAVQGKTVEEARSLFRRFRSMVKGNGNASGQGLGKLAAFCGVSAFPVRVKCAILGWHALEAALEGEAREVTTE